MISASMNWLTQQAALSYAGCAEPADCTTGSHDDGAAVRFVRVVTAVAVDHCHSCSIVPILLSAPKLACRSVDKEIRSWLTRIRSGSGASWMNYGSIADMHRSSDRVDGGTIGRLRL